MAEDPTNVAQEAQTSAPVVVCFEDVDETSSYYLIIEKKVPIGGLTFSKSLALWFSLHYIFNSEYDKSISELVLSFQEFIFGLPASRIKKSSTYLTVTSDIQTFTIA